MWFVIQVMETGEEVYAEGEFEALHHAELWIEQNHDQYPESSFYVEHE